MADDERMTTAKATFKRLYGIDYKLPTGPNDPPGSEFFDAQMFKNAFADSWSRTALTDRERGLITVAMIIAAQGPERELRAHVRGTRALGVSDEAIVEVLVHAGAYLGAITTARAWPVVRKALSD
jgi:alkylhydroperoxidase/carboxymuconolactone decarboxylase family protein YurZ